MKETLSKFLKQIYLLRLGMVLSLLPALTSFAQSPEYLSTYLTDNVYNRFTVKYDYTLDARVWTSFYLSVNVASDDAIAGGNSIDDAEDLQKADSFNHNTTSLTSSYLWKKYMLGIEACNYVLRKADDSDAGYSRVVAEAKFMRAYNYFHFVRIFGKVPIIDTDCQPLISDLSRNSISEVYAFIINDLLAAESGLPQKTALLAGEEGRATIGAAQTLLAKVYLYNEQWAEALTEAEKVINSGEYSLESDFADLWREDNEHCVESIFELELNADQSMDWQGVSYNNLDIQAMGVRNISSNDTYNSGWGICIPTANLYNAFVDANDSIRRVATFITETELADSGIQFEPSFNHTGFWNKKYATKKEFESSYDLVYGQNEIKLRYAEVLLMAAEASAELGQDVDAQNYINQVRARAGLPMLISTGTTLLEDIYNERRLELALESNRLFDLKRWGKLDEVMAPLGFNTATDGLWPVPQDIVDLNSQITQNAPYVGETGNYNSLVMHNLPDPQYVNNSFFPQFRSDYESFSKVENYLYNICFSDSLIQSVGTYTNDNNKKTEFLGQGYNKYLDEYIPSRKATYSYNSDGYIESQVSLMYNFNEIEWDTNWRSQYAYDNNGYVTQILMGQDIWFEKHEIIWNTDYTSYEELSYYQSGTDWNFVYAYKHDLIFDNDRLINDVYYYKVAGGEYSLMGKYVNNYNADFSELEYLYYNSPDGVNYELSSRSVITFDDEGRQISSIYYAFDDVAGTFTIPAQKVESIYNKSNNTKTVINYKYSAELDEFERETSALIYYFNESSSINDGAKVNSESISIYPNPVKDVLMIESKNNLPTSVELYSLDGKLIESFVFNGSYTHDVSEYEPQICVLKIQNNNTILTKQIVIQ